MTAPSRSAFVALVGRPNAGKSSLLNALLGEKISIVSEKPQTTRTRITGILTEGAVQLVFLDTPGLMKPKNALGNCMMREVRKSVGSVDLAVLVTDASDPREDLSDAETALLGNLKAAGLPAFAALNKIDLLKRKELLIPRMARLAEIHPFREIVPVSAKTGDGVPLLKSLLTASAPEGPHCFEDDALTDQPERVILAELLREQALAFLREEVPHGIAVLVGSVRERESGGGPITDVSAVLHCDRESHKRIIIGKGGRMLKRIASAARAEMEAFLRCRVNLQCRVRVREGWRNTGSALRDFGYRAD